MYVLDSATWLLSQPLTMSEDWIKRMVLKREVSGRDGLDKARKAEELSIQGHKGKVRKTSWPQCASHSAIWIKVGGFRGAV